MRAVLNTQGQSPVRRRFRISWPSLVIALLSVHVIGMLFAASIVMQHHGDWAVIPDYYQKAENWDGYRKQLSASNQLGWNLIIQPADSPDSNGNRQVSLNFTDAQGKPVEHAAVNVNCFHLSHGDQARIISAEPSGAGRYTISLPENFSGFWQFEISADLNQQHFIQTATQWVD